MPLFSRHDKDDRKSRGASPAPEPVDAVGLSQALLVELRGQRQDFKQTYALLESRLDKLEKAISRQPREAAAAAPAAGAGAARSPSDEEMRYVLGDAESMEIIVNLGPLRTGRPLQVERRALTPAARKWWASDQENEPEDLAGECIPPPRPPPGQQRPGRVVMDPASRHASFHAGKFAAQVEPSRSTATAGTRAPSSYHWVIGRDGGLRDQRPPTPNPPPPPPPPPPRPPVTPPAPKRGQQQPPGPPPAPPSIVAPAPEPVSGVLRNKDESTAPTRLNTQKNIVKPREEQPVSCVVLLAPDDQRGQGQGVRGASSVCFSLEEEDDGQPVVKAGAGAGTPGPAPRRGILGRPLSKATHAERAGGQGKEETTKSGAAEEKDAKIEQEDKRPVQVGRHGERRDEKVGPGTSGISLLTLHRNIPVDFSSSNINTLVVPGLVQPSSSVCFSLEEYEKEQAEEEAAALRKKQGLGTAKVAKASKPTGQYRAHAMHGPYGPHRPYGAKRSTSAARLAWWRRSAPPSEPPPGRSIRHEPAGPGDAVDEEGLRGCLRCVEYRASPRAVPGPRLPVRLRIGSSRQSRVGMGAQLRAWDGGHPRRHRSPQAVHRRALQDDAEESVSRPPSRVGSSVSPRVVSRKSVCVSATKSNIHLAKIYAKTDLVSAAAYAAPPPRPSGRSGGGPHRPLQHLPTCPRYDGADIKDGKQLLTLFESRAVGEANLRAAAQSARDHRDYLAHLSEYVRAISKGPRPATVIRNQLRVRTTSPDAGGRGPAGRRGSKQQPQKAQKALFGVARCDCPDTPGAAVPVREQLRWREPLAILDVQDPESGASPRAAGRHKHRGELTDSPRAAHRKHTCRDSRSQRPRGRRRTPEPASPAASLADCTDEQDPPPGAHHCDGAPPNNTICSFICDYCRKLRQML